MQLRIPSDKEYKALVSVTGGDNSKMHWDKILSMLEDTENEYDIPTGYEGGRGFSTDLSWFYHFKTDRNATSGFRPAVEVIPSSIPSDIIEGMSCVIGTLYMAGQPVKVPQIPTWDGDIQNYVPCAKLEMRESLEDPTFQVIGIYLGNGVFVADRVMLHHISHLDVHSGILPETHDLKTTEILRIITVPDQSLGN